MNDRSMKEPPPSPCISICALNEDSYCIGCLRSLEEIAAWSTMDAEAQRAVLDKLPERRKTS